MTQGHRNHELRTTQGQAPNVTERDVPMEYGRRLSVAMSDAGLDAHELGDRLGVSAHAVRRWRRGEVMPTAIMLRRLACELGVSADYLLALREGRRE